MKNPFKDLSDNMLQKLYKHRVKRLIEAREIRDKYKELNALNEIHLLEEEIKRDKRNVY